MLHMCHLVESACQHCCEVVLILILCHCIDHIAGAGKMFTQTHCRDSNRLHFMVNAVFVLSKSCDHGYDEGN